ncbi:protein ORF133 [Cyprinid herpesvirus 3]|uniref:Protein ORF133 n=1 Tax=Cyprinid herpesvirus 3 TaxID=180230 RepID=A3QMU9_CYHV3|nr:unnamed protein product [Cyprinid herpesvirus 3]ABC55112.1 hypothetical protein [Cyprinid herpesvirus 3]ABG42960.1 protein ORF133 [Cyprinid herpesvirus 3]AJP55619.1 protein ORF133 [Cyprinid herpesvirus 3]AJP55774.1 protein ORF133 [Cyprinid herpesvirus 3]AOO32536.1 protein ORF133 [Cyprinid herpesvirus 3]
MGQKHDKYQGADLEINDLEINVPISFMTPEQIAAAVGRNGQAVFTFDAKRSRHKVNRRRSELGRQRALPPPPPLRTRSLSAASLPLLPDLPLPPPPSPPSRVLSEDEASNLPEPPVECLTLDGVESTTAPPSSSSVLSNSSIRMSKPLPTIPEVSQNLSRVRRMMRRGGQGKNKRLQSIGQQSNHSVSSPDLSGGDDSDASSVSGRSRSVKQDLDGTTAMRAILVQLKNVQEKINDFHRETVNMDEREIREQLARLVKEKRMCEMSLAAARQLKEAYAHQSQQQLSALSRPRAASSSSHQPNSVNMPKRVMMDNSYYYVTQTGRDSDV